MDRKSAVAAYKTFMASAAALGGVLYGADAAGSAGAVGSGEGAGADPLREWSADCLDGLALVRTADAQLAGLKVGLVAGFSDAEWAMASPDEHPDQRLGRDMGIVAEVACVLTVSERSSSALLAESHELTRTLPLTLAGLQEGSLSWQHARAMVDEAASLDPEGAAALEAHFLDPDAPDAAERTPVGEMLPSRFRARARCWRERHHPESIEKRHARSFADRRLEYAPDRDGMAWLSAYLPADQAAGIWNRTTSAARALQGPGEDRTLTQRRADVAAILLLGGNAAGHGTTAHGTAGHGTAGGTAADLPADRETTSGHTGEQDHDLAHGRAGGAADATAGQAAGSVLADAVSIPGGVHPGSVAGGGQSGSLANDGRAGDALAGKVVADVLAGRVPTPSAQVLLTVPVFSLIGLTDEPADLDGYGPIPASMARKLVADGASSFRRVLTDPRDGVPLEIGRTSYPIPTAMRQWLRLRDGRCSFPGCTNHSLDNDTDHILAWADGGTTGVSNLESLCRKHHRLKHTTAWTPTGASKNKPPGWTSPTGRHYPSEHPNWEPPQLPAMVLDALQELKRKRAREPEHVPDPEQEATESGLGAVDGDRFPAIEQPHPQDPARADPVAEDIVPGNSGPGDRLSETSSR